MLFYGGEENVPGAPGVRFKTNSGTGAPVAFNPYNQLQTIMMPGDPTMTGMGNAGFFLNAAGGPVLPGEPGRDPIPTAPGGRPHLPGEKQTPLPGRLQAMGSSNLNEAIPGAPGNIAGQITNAENIQFRRLNPGSMIERERDAWGKAKPLDERIRHFSKYLI